MVRRTFLQKTECYCWPFALPTMGAFSHGLLVGTILFAVVLTVDSRFVQAQYNGFPPSNTPISPGITGGMQSPVDIPQTNLQPMGAGAAPSFGLNAYPPAIGGHFDPYAASGTSLPSYPAPAYPDPMYSAPVSSMGSPFAPIGNSSGALLPPLRTGGESLFSRVFSHPASSPLSSGGQPAFGGTYGGFEGATIAPPATYGGSSYGNPTFGSPAYTDPAYPTGIYPSGSPTTLFPGGLFSGPGSLFGLNNGDGMSAYRILQGPRIRHAFLASGDDPDALNINDTDVSMVLAFPNFLYSSEPLMVAPSFSLHLWDGPEPTTMEPQSLPPTAYSAFLDLGWQSDPNQILGVELGARVGVFTELDELNSKSLRVMGKGLVNFRLTPTTTLKAGVMRLDRIRYDVIPAGGILWQPDPYTRFDIFFPQPKLARYWRTVGTQDVWWYLGGEYGGGNWTVKRDNLPLESTDINDFRVMVGFEWGQQEFIRAGRRNAFVEAGYVFDREILYSNKNNEFAQDDAIMFRAGIGY